MKHPPTMAYIAGAVLLAASIGGWLIDPVLFWAAYLAAWWFCTGIVLGALANVWIHNLTGGAWGEALREPLLGFGRAMPLLAVLFLPLLFGAHELYPWVASAGEGSARWSGELSAPAFKRIWLSPLFFTVRSLGYLAIWLVLAYVTHLPRYSRSRSWSAAAMLIYATSASLASIDWLMSLMPLWFSTAFPPLVITGQMLGAFAAGALAAAIRSTAPRAVFRDLGNLLLMYVLMWAYLAYTQYLIIWAENLPHEIAWYVARLHTSWYWIGWTLIACHFFLPLLILLSREAKGIPIVIASIAGGLLALHLIDVWWIIVPSVRPDAPHVLWLAPLAAAGMLVLTGARVLHLHGERARG